MRNFATMTDEENKKQRRKDYQKIYAKEYMDMNRRVSMTISKKEYELLKEKGEKVGWKPATLAREIVLSRLEGSPIIPRELDNKIVALSCSMAKIAGNINQIAKHSNYTKRLVDEKGLITELANLNRVIRDFITEEVTKKDDNKSDPLDQIIP